MVDLPDVEAREKELYARFGEAALGAQSFERAFALVLAFRDSMGNVIDGEAPDLDQLIEKWNAATAGRMARSLRTEYGAIPDSTMELWDRAVRERNRLMHRFFIELFTEQALDIRSVAAMQSAVDDLDQLRVLFEGAAAQCHDVRDTTLRNVQTRAAEVGER